MNTFSNNFFNFSNLKMDFFAKGSPHNEGGQNQDIYLWNIIWYAFDSKFATSTDFEKKPNLSSKDSNLMKNRQSQKCRTFAIRKFSTGK